MRSGNLSELGERKQQPERARFGSRFLSYVPPSCRSNGVM